MPLLRCRYNKFIERCLAKESADRYANTRQLAVQLREIREHWDRATGRLRRMCSRPHSPRRRRRPPAATASA